MDDRLASRSMMMPLTEREKMRAEATAYIEKGEALLAAASRGTQFPPTVGGSGSDLSQIYSPAVHSSMMSSMHNNNPSNTIQSMARSSSVFDGTSATSTSGLSTYLDRPFHNNGLSSPPHQPNAYTGMSMSMGMGMGGMGGGGAASMYGGGSTLQDMYSDADLISASDRNQLRLERLMIMRRREQSMMLNEERARAEALRLTSNMKAAAASVVTPGSELDTEQTLAALGNSMRKKSSPYIDTSGMADPPAYELSRRRTRGGVTEPFPEKLHRMLLEIEKDGDAPIISFFPHGRAFGIHNPDKFEEKLMPKYYKQSRLSSFQRQLNLYGFTRIISGPDSGGYYHELFLKGRPALCTHMRRVGIPKGVDRRKLKSSQNKKEPDFYSMRPSV